MTSTENVAQQYETLVVTREDAVVTVELHRPERLNAITKQLGQELTAALHEADADPSVRAVVLTGSGRAFSSGADLSSFDDDRPMTAAGKPDLGHLLRETYNPLVLLMREMRTPIIAAVNGPAAGVGCSFALACDYVVAAESSYFLLAFVNVALVPDGGASAMVTARAGIGRALEMAMLGRKVPASDAVAWNLANELVPDGEALPTAQAVAAKLAAGPPEALAAIKQLLNRQVLDTLRETLAAEADAQTGRSESGEVVEAVSAFLQKRKPTYG